MQPLTIDGDSSKDWVEIGQELFGIDYEDSRYLFTPGRPLEWFEETVRLDHASVAERWALDLFNKRDALGRLQRAATPKNVARSIRAFIRFKQTGKKSSAKSLTKNKKPKGVKP